MFKIGDTVRIKGLSMKGSVGIVVHHDEKRGKYLVRVTDMLQDYYVPEDIELFVP